MKNFNASSSNLKIRNIISLNNIMLILGFILIVSLPNIFNGIYHKIKNKQNISSQIEKRNIDHSILEEVN